MGLFGIRGKTDAVLITTQSSVKAEWSSQEKLEKEKEVMGFYLSSHPLDHYQKMINCITHAKILDLIEAIEHKKSIPLDVTVCGLVTNKKIITTKKGLKMAFLSIEDQTGTSEVIVFPKTFSKVEPVLSSHHVIIVQGQLDEIAFPSCKIKAADIFQAELLMEKISKSKKVIFNLGLDNIEGKMKQLDTLSKGNIAVEIIFSENNRTLKVISNRKVSFQHGDVGIFNTYHIKSCFEL